MMQQKNEKNLALLESEELDTEVMAFEVVLYEVLWDGFGDIEWN